MINGILITLLCLWFIAGCSNDNTIAGGTEAGNARVIGMVVNDDGSPAQSLTVGLHSVFITADGDSIIDTKTAQTDSEGAYVFHFVDDGRYVVFCRDEASGNTGIIQRCSLVNEESVENEDLVLQSSVTLKGRVTVEGGGDISIMSILIPGTGIKTSPDTGGFYMLGGVPRSAVELSCIMDNTVNYFPLDLSADSPDTVNLKEVAFATADSQAAARDSYYETTLDNAFVVYAAEEMDSSVLFDDFEDSDSRNALAGILYPSDELTLGVWGAWPLGTHTLAPAGFPQNFEQACVSDGAFHGLSLRITFDVDEAAADRPGIYVDLGDGYYDLSRISEMSFYARGSGDIRIAFNTDTVNSGEGPFIYDFTLTSEWRRISVAAEDIIPEPGSISESIGLAWEDGAPAVSQISFHALTDAEMWLDEIYLVGLTVGDM